MEKNITYFKSYSNFLSLTLLLLAFILNQNFLQAQISYSCDMETCGSIWDNNGFYDDDSYDGGCTGDGLRDNVWSSDTKVATWNSTAITGHNGGELTITFKCKLVDYYSPYADRTGSEWGNLKVYYKSSTPSEGSPGTQIGSNITSMSE